MNAPIQASTVGASSLLPRQCRSGTPCTSVIRTRHIARLRVPYICHVHWRARIRDDLLELLVADEASQRSANQRAGRLTEWQGNPLQGYGRDSGQSDWQTALV